MGGGEAEADTERESGVSISRPLWEAGVRWGEVAVSGEAPSSNEQRGM